jgi:hypothetical protein
MRGLWIAGGAVLVLAGMAWIFGVRGFSGGGEPQAHTAPPPGGSTGVAAEALPAERTGGFDGLAAYRHVEQLVSFGPRTPGSAGSRKAQEYIAQELKGYGCAVEADEFEAATPLGRVAMKNLVAKIRGKSEDLLLLMSHYDTLRMENFVGANDSGSSTAVMLELARRLCQRENALSIWIAFVDGEEAFVQWSDTDSTYGSRQLAARMALSGDLKRTKAVLLADMVGDRNLNLNRELNSTPWLRTLVVETAERLGYGAHFAGEATQIEDDHVPFLRRGIPAVDLIDFDYPHWHTPADTLDKISPRSMAIVGHVLLEVIPELEKKFSR